MDQNIQLMATLLLNRKVMKRLQELNPGLILPTEEEVEAFRQEVTQEIKITTQKIITWE